MATGTVAAPAVNGVHHAPSSIDLAQYGKLIKLRDDVFVGHHPTLKIALTTLSASQDSVSGLPPRNAMTLASNSAVHASILPVQNSNLTGQYAVSSSNIPNHMPAPNMLRNGQLVSIPLPGFDPASLDSGPLLIPPEKGLSRKDIEMMLQHELKRRVTEWPRLDRENILPEFDVDEILRNAQEEVKPLSLEDLKPSTKEADASPASADDNSYYSSQANDEEDYTRPQPTKPCAYFFKGKCFRGDDCNFSHDPAFEAQLKSRGSLTEFADKSHAAASTAEGPLPKRAKKDEASRSQQFNHGPLNLTQESPASAKRRADEQYARDLARAGSTYDRDSRYNGGSHVRTPTTNRRMPEPERRFSGRGPSPNHDIHVVRNHITSPAMPQPARVSPLAVAKGPRVDHLHMDPSRVHSSQSTQFWNDNIPSPGNMQPPMSRKRRRDPNTGDESEVVFVRRRMGSPEVQIKNEPISPKPLENIPNYRYVPRKEVARVAVATNPYPQYGVDRIEPEPVREVRYVDEQPEYRRASSPVIRVLSRAEPRYEARREPDLRRVVSERLAMRPASPAASSARPPVYYDEPQRSARAPSVVYLSRSENDPPVSYPPSVAPPNHSMRGDYAAEPQRLHSPIMHQASNMPPPSMPRLVRERFGNEIYQDVVPESRRTATAPGPAYAHRPASRIASVAPEPSSQYREPSIVQRRAETESNSPRYVDYQPQSSTRVQRQEPEYIFERPQIVRLSEAPGPNGHYERVIYRGPPPPPPAYAERPREVYYDEPPARDAVYRVQSVRPEAPRYVESVEDRYMRQMSIRPQPQEGYERVVAHPMAPPGARYEYVDGRDGGGYAHGQLGVEKSYVVG